MKRAGIGLKWQSAGSGRRARVGKSLPPPRRLAVDPDFPAFFFLRNVLELSNEAWWRSLPPRLRRARLIEMLCERLAVVRQVRSWTRRHGRPAPPTPEDRGHASDISDYCTHCGMCCETASGYPDFPPWTKIPERWQRLFGDGLGRGHRFCPFLWESKTPRGSLCAIHPWRAGPCRVFERDDCEFVRQDPDFRDLGDRRKELVVAWRWLVRLIDAG